MLKKIILVSVSCFSLLFLSFLFRDNTYAQTSATDGVGVSLTITEASATTSGGSVPLFVLQPPKEQEEFIPPVDNPDNLKAEVKIEGVNLSWSNPQVEDFSYVRIIRNEDKFRNDPFVGKLIYEGKGEGIMDKETIPGKEYFYVLFTRNEAGNFSSGSAVSAKTFEFIKKPPLSETPKERTSQTETESTENKEEIRSKEEAPVYLVRQIKQKVEKLSEKEAVAINSEQNIIVDTDNIAEGDFLKVIGPKGETLGKYMFSFNENSGRYESVIPPLKSEGSYKITVYRYTGNSPLVLSKGSVYVSHFLSDDGKTNQGCEGFGCNLVEYIKYIFVLTVLFLIFKITI